MTQTALVPSVQIKDVPATTHATLQRRAAEAHQSLQEFLRSHLIRYAAEPTLDEVLGEIDALDGGTLSFRDAAEALDADRARR